MTMDHFYQTVQQRPKEQIKVNKFKNFALISSKSLTSKIGRAIWKFEMVPVYKSKTRFLNGPESKSLDRYMDCLKNYGYQTTEEEDSETFHHYDCLSKAEVDESGGNFFDFIKTNHPEEFELQIPKEDKKE